MQWNPIRVYLFRFFDDLALIYPFYVLLFAEHGMSPAEVVLLVAVWSVATSLFEVPSGILADTIPRRYVLFLGQSARACSLVLWIFWPTFWGFFIGMTLWGVKSACLSGTLQALVYDSLKSEGREGEYAKIIGRSRTASYAGGIVAALCAAVLITFGYPFILAVSAVAVLISGFIALSLPSVQAFESTGERAYFSVAAQGFRYLRAMPRVLALLLFVALFCTQYSGIEEFFPILVEADGVPKAYIALFIGAISLVQALVSAYTYVFTHITDRVLGILLVIEAGLFVVAAFFSGFVMLVSLGVVGGIHSALVILFDARIQKVVPSPIRATIPRCKVFCLKDGKFAFMSYTGLVQRTWGIRPPSSSLAFG